MKTTIEKFRLSKDRTFLQSVQLNICRGCIHLGALACVSIHRSVKSLRLIRPSLQFRAIFREQLNIFQAFVICDEISQTPVYLLDNLYFPTFQKGALGECQISESGNV